MATSPIYNWPEPDNTDLVKNGALAIRTLGNAIDTTMATMVPKTIVDAKGDLIAGTAADTAARLAVGANGETLVADASTSTGLRYQAPVNFNPVLNSAFQIWQRGTSVAVSSNTSPYTADRWQMFLGLNQNSTVSRQLTNDTTNLPFIQYCARVQRNSGQTGTNQIVFQNAFETINSVAFSGKTVTYSFYARKGADFSATSSILSTTLYSGTGTDQNPNVSGYTGAVGVVSSNAILTTTWQRFTFTGTVPTNSNELAVWFAHSPTGTASTNDYYEVTGVQIEVGSVATPFKTYAGTIQGELAACQRYYYRNTAGVAYGGYGSAVAASSVLGWLSVNLPVTMRTTPTSLDWSNLTIQFYNNTFIVPSALSLNTAIINPNVAALDATISGATAGYFGRLLNNNNTAGYIGFSAEL